MSEGLAAVRTEGAQPAASSGTFRAEKQPPKAKDLTSEMKRAVDAFERMDLAVAELDTAVALAEKSTVPGLDLRANLVAKLGPVLARIGHEVLPAKKTRGAKK